MTYYACIWCFLAGSVVLVSGFFFSGLKPTKDVRKRCLSMPVDGPRHMVFDWYRLTSTIASRMVLDTDLVDVLDRPRLIPYSTVMHRDQSGEQSESVKFYCFL